MILVILFLAARAQAVCSVGQKLSLAGKPSTLCQVISRADGKIKNVYIIHCGGEVLRVQAPLKAERLDPLTLETLEVCEARPEIHKMTAEFDQRQDEIAKPTCVFERRESQMTFRTATLQGRCSFRMNQNDYQSFLRTTHLKPTYQCEHGVFLVGSDVFTSSGKNDWTKACSARLQVQSEERPADIDWSHPPHFYEPPEPLITP